MRRRLASVLRSHQRYRYGRGTESFYKIFVSTGSRRFSNSFKLQILQPIVRTVTSIFQVSFMLAWGFGFSGILKFNLLVFDSVTFNIKLGNFTGAFYQFVVENVKLKQSS